MDQSTLDLSRSFLPEALAGVSLVRSLDEADRRQLNQIRACSYLHLFDLFERAVSSAARARAGHDVDVRETLAPLLRFDSFDHHELFGGFEAAFGRVFPVRARLVDDAVELGNALEVAAPYSLLVFALHLKLVTQQHYLACVRGDERLEPRFVRLLKDHWAMECGQERMCGSVVAVQQALARVLPGRIPSALRDYRLLVFAADDVLHRQAELDVATFEDARGGRLVLTERPVVLQAQIAAHRKTFLTVGIVNAAFVYSMRSLGPTAPSILAGVVSALSSRV